MALYRVIMLWTRAWRSLKNESKKSKMKLRSLGTNRQSADDDNLLLMFTHINTVVLITWQVPLHPLITDNSNVLRPPPPIVVPPSRTMCPHCSYVYRRFHAYRFSASCCY